MSPGPLDSINIKNYRIFNELSIAKLNRINLITGQNNVGKTSLLEALFLLSGGGNPQMVLNSHIIRHDINHDINVNGPSDTMFETYWKPLFATLDIGKTIKISANHRFEGPISLNISSERPNIIEFPIDSQSKLNGQFQQGEFELLFKFERQNNPSVESRVRVTSSNIQIKQPDTSAPINSIILLTNLVNHQDDAKRLGRLRKQKKAGVVLESLKVIESKLHSIEDNSSSGFPMIWGDLGFSELIPLTMMGEGMTRLARLVLAIASTPRGIVLVDEVETGFHHSVFTDIWRVVEKAAKQNETQVIATTHSYECVQAACETLSDEDGFLLHRIEKFNGGLRSVTYNPEDLHIATKHNLEMR